MAYKYVLFSIMIGHIVYADDVTPVVFDLNGNQISSIGGFDISDDGRWIVFDSSNNQIVPNDTNSLNRSFDVRGPASDVFLLDRKMNEVKRVSLRHDGSQIENGRSFFRSVDKNFKHILYMSEGNSQFPNDTVEYDGHPDPDIYCYNTMTKQTNWLSISPNGMEGNNFSERGIISGNGQFAYIVSGATNLLNQQEPYNSYAQLIQIDLFNGERELVSVSMDGNPPNLFIGNIGSIPHAVNFNGRFVTFLSNSTNLTEEGVGGLFVRDMQTKTTKLVSRDPDGIPIQFEQFFEPNYLDMSDDGRYIFFTSPSNQHVVNDPHPQEKSGDDGFIYDRVTKQTKIISLGRFESKNRESGIVKGSMSSNGRYVIGVTRIDNGATFPELFLYDQFNETAELLLSKDTNHPLLPSPNISGIPRITSDGKHVLFSNAVYDEGGRYLQSNILYLMTRDVSTSYVDAWDAVD